MFLASHRDRQASVSMRGAVITELKAYDDAASALNVRKAIVYDREQGWQVMSPDLKAAVLVFQAEHHIPRMGELDYETLHKLSGQSVGAILSEGSQH